MAKLLEKYNCPFFQFSLPATLLSFTLISCHIIFGFACGQTLEVIISLILSNIIIYLGYV